MKSSRCVLILYINKLNISISVRSTTIGQFQLDRRLLSLLNLLKCCLRSAFCAGKVPEQIPKRRWVDNIRMDLHEVGCGYMDWIGLAQDRDRWRKLVSAVMNRCVP